MYQDHVRPYWHRHNDGSLRGESAEFVLAKPISRKEVRPALDKLFEVLSAAGTKIRKDSPNTSVHVHVNVQDLSLKQVYTYITLWYILEDMLVEWCGENRVGNVFCLRGSDAEVAIQRLITAMKFGKYNTLNDQNGLRYLALNYTSIGKFGSLEFRPMAGVYDTEVISTWVEILLSLKDYSLKFTTPAELIREYSSLGEKDFLQQAIPKFHSLVKTKNYVNQLHEGMRLIQGVAYAVNWDKEGVKKKDELDVPLKPFQDRDPFAPLGNLDGLPVMDWAAPRKPGLRKPPRGPDPLVLEAQIAARAQERDRMRDMEIQWARQAENLVRGGGIPGFVHDEADAVNPIVFNDDNGED